MIRTPAPRRESVVLTGIGVVSPLGIGADRFLDALLSGRSGFQQLDAASEAALPGRVAAPVDGFDDKAARKTWLKQARKSVKLMCREIQMGVAAANLAYAESGLGSQELDHDRLGVVFGSNYLLGPFSDLQKAVTACTNHAQQFEFGAWATAGLEELEPIIMLRYLPNMAACHTAVMLDARGPCNSITLAEASGNLALGEAFHAIQRGRADVMVAGTSGSRLAPWKCLVAALCQELARAEDDETVLRPFDRRRNGQIVGEGACSFVLENERHARARGARIFARVLGTGSSCVVDRQGQPNREQALVNAMHAALRDANVDATRIGHVNAHGEATIAGDAAEANAIRRVFGDFADELPVTALKSYFGNSGAGCGSLELAGSLLALDRGIVPPTLNHRWTDPACPVRVVHEQPFRTTNPLLVKTSVTATAQASALVLEGIPSAVDDRDPLAASHDVAEPVAAR